MDDNNCVEILRRVAEGIERRREETMISRKLPRKEQAEELLRIEGERKAVAYAIGRIDALRKLSLDST